MDAEESIAGDDGRVGIGCERLKDGDGLLDDLALVIEAEHSRAVVFRRDDQPVAPNDRRGNVEVAGDWRLQRPETLAGSKVPAVKVRGVMADDLPFAAERADVQRAVAGRVAGRFPDRLSGGRIESDERRLRSAGIEDQLAIGQ